MPPITVPDNIVRLTWNFGLHQGGVPSEVAEMTLNGRILDAFGNEPASFPDESVWVDLLNTLSAAAYNAWSSIAGASQFPLSLTLESVRCALNNTLGHTKAESYHTNSPAAPWHGTGSASLPWQLSWCVSNYAQVPGLFTPGGRSRRGRVYYPPFATSMLNDSDDGQISAGAVTSLLANWNNIVKAIATTSLAPAAPGLTWQSGVLSARTSSWHETQYWRADPILDTQRRRRNRETAPYTNKAYLS